ARGGDGPRGRAIRHAKEGPSWRGGRMFADMRPAYDALSGEMKQGLARMVGLQGRHDGPAGVRLYADDPDQRIDRAYPEKARPAVVTHPLTGPPILFVNPLPTPALPALAPS